MTGLTRRYGTPIGIVILLLAAFWILVLVVLPNLQLFEQSFRPLLPPGEQGGPADVYSLDNYAIMVSTNSTTRVWFIDMPIHLFIFLRTIWHSCLVTLVCLVLSYPVAWCLALVMSPRSVPTILMLLAIPLLVSELLRAFSWYIILAFQGPLNGIGAWFGLPKVRWISGSTGIVVTLIYTNILLMVLPIYNSLSTLDRNLIEAARDLGASGWQVQRRIVMPHAKTGIASGCTMIFMFSVGSVVIPIMMASPDSRWFTEVITQWMFESQDWHTAAAYAFILLVTCTVFVALMMRLFRVQLADIAK